MNFLDLLNDPRVKIISSTLYAIASAVMFLTPSYTIANRVASVILTLGVSHGVLSPGVKVAPPPPAAVPDPFAPISNP